MRTFKLLILGLILCFSANLSAQTLNRAVRTNPKLSIKSIDNCKSVLRPSLKGTVREPNHQVSKKVRTYMKDGKFYIKCITPNGIKENDFIWAKFPFKPGYPSGKIVGMQLAYKTIPTPNNSARRVYISQERIVQGNTPFKGTVKLDDPTNLYNSGIHSSTPFGGGFLCGTNYKTVSLKLVMQPGDVICIEGIRILFKCKESGRDDFKCPQRLPNPKIKLAGKEASGNYIRYKIPVYNYMAFPDYIFAAAPSLPACGLNNNSSRTWIDIVDQNNNRIYGFCAFNKAANMKNIWFSVKRGTKPPSRVRIIIKDRGCNKRYASNWISIQ